MQNFFIPEFAFQFPVKTITQEDIEMAVNPLAEDLYVIETPNGTSLAKGNFTMSSRYSFAIHREQ